jgi:hypothetical protein
LLNRTSNALPASISRTAFAAAILAVSVLIHLGLLGVIVLAERRVLPQVQREAIDVELVKPPEQPDPPNEEAAKPPQSQEAPKPQKPDANQAQKPQPKISQKSAKASSPEQPETSEPSAAERLEKEDKPEIPSGGPPSENQAKLTAEEIAAFRAQIQKCWQLPVGMPDAMKLEVVLRVGFSRTGALVVAPELLKAPASVHGPALVGIAMRAITQCAPYRTLPVAKYKEWRVLDLRFLATGLAGLDTRKPPRG